MSTQPVGYTQWCSTDTVGVVAVELPQASGDDPQESGDDPQASGDDPQKSGDDPQKRYSCAWKADGFITVC